MLQIVRVCCKMPRQLKVATGSDLGVLEKTAACLSREQGCFCAPQGWFSHETPLGMELSPALGFSAGVLQSGPLGCWYVPTRTLTKPSTRLPGATEGPAARDTR